MCYGCVTHVLWKCDGYLMDKYGCLIDVIYLLRQLYCKCHSNSDTISVVAG